MKLSGLFRIIACVIWIGGIIAGAVLSMTDGRHVDFGVAIIYWCAFAAAGLIFTAIGAHLENQETMIALLRKNGQPESKNKEDKNEM